MQSEYLLHERLAVSNVKAYYQLKVRLAVYNVQSFHQRQVRLAVCKRAVLLATAS